MKLLLPLALAFLVGCQSVNWNQRIGAYTYNDALTEHGVPAKSVNMKDGSSIHGWNWYHRIPPWMDELILGFDRNGRLISGQEKRYYSHPNDMRKMRTRPDHAGGEQLKNLNKKIGELTGELHDLRWEMEAERFRERDN